MEALNGTLRAAKRQKVVGFEKELLMMPSDKDVAVTLLKEKDIVVSLSIHWSRNNSSFLTLNFTSRRI